MSEGEHARLCMWCGEELEVEDRLKPIQGHQECSFRAVIGSVGHIQHKCSCYGGTVEDPVGMSRRDAARLAVIEHFKTSGAAPWGNLTQEERARLRPSIYGTLPPSEQWAIDTALGILDWEGLRGKSEQAR